MVEQYGWIVVSVIIALVGLYSTILNIKAKNSKPVDDLKDNFFNLDKSVVRLIASLNNLSDKYESSVAKNEAIHADLVNNIKQCMEKLTDHEIRIINVENKIDSVNQKIDTMNK